MKLIGWILILIGSNGITAALVARRSIRYDMDFLSDVIVARVTEILGAEQGILNTLVLRLVDNLTDGLVEMLGVDHRYVQLVDRLFYGAVGLLILGLTLLAIGYIRGRRANMQ